MNTTFNGQSELLEDEMSRGRQVGVRRTRRKKVIISVVILACVMGAWQMFRRDENVLYVGGSNVGAHDVRKVFPQGSNEKIPIPNAMKPHIIDGDSGSKQNRDKSNIVEDGDRPGVEVSNKTDNQSTIIQETMNFKYASSRYYASEGGQIRFIKFVDSGEFTPLSRKLQESPFSVNDKVCLTILTGAQLREIYSIQHHDNLRLVAFDAPTIFKELLPIESCPLCGTIKQPKDISEVLAFHVDRTLGVDRAMPVSARKFTAEELANLEFNRDQIDDTFPVMWFASDLVHGGGFQGDQNSVQLNWKQYQEILHSCQEPNSTYGVDCTEIEYSEWSRMAVLDFVMQNHDRLDRYCCGYDDDEGETCFHNEIRGEIDYDCEDTASRFLVHILISQSDPSRLVLLDNVGNLHRHEDHLNYELLKGIRTIPHEIMKSIDSGDFDVRLTSSLKWDPVYMENIADDVLKQQVDTITRRVEKLRRHIKNHNITSITNLAV